MFKIIITALTALTLSSFSADAWTRSKPMEGEPPCAPTQVLARQFGAVFGETLQWVDDENFRVVVANLQNGTWTYFTSPDGGTTSCLIAAGKDYKEGDAEEIVLSIEKGDPA